MNRAGYYPEHDRTSCSDANPVNSEAGGSRGCARCTAILLDQRDELLAALQRLLPAYRQAVKLYDPNHDDALTVQAHNAIARAQPPKE